MRSKFARGFCLLMAVLLILLTVTACGGGEVAEPSPEPEVPTQVTPAPEPEVTEEAQVFTGTAIGHGGTVTVDVTVLGEDIVDVEVVSHSETMFFYDLPFARTITALVNDRNLNADIVAGATMSSMAIRAAIMDALTQADFDIVSLMLPRVEPVGGETIELVADVVVIGGGGAGLAAAVTASQEGSSVIVIEKMPMLGGNTIISGSGYNAVNPRLQEAEDPPVEDSLDLHFQQTYEGGDRVGTPELIRILVENALDGIYWLQDLGMEWQEGIFTVPGSLHRRSNSPVMPLGLGFIDTYQRYIDRPDSNIEVLFETRAYELIQEDGAVVGVRATNADNNTVIVRAESGVVMATGGFGANIEMRMYYDALWHVLDEAVPTTNFVGALGDGITMGVAVGANLVGMDYIQLLPFGEPGTGSLSGLIGSSMEDHIYVNMEGLRFVDEGARRDDMTAATLAQTGSRMYVIIDSRTVPTGAEFNFFGESHDMLVEYGRIHRADTLEELAQMMGVPIEAFVQTIEDFNEAVDAGIDEFGRTVFRGRIEQAPFYAGARMPTVHHTMGGLQIDVYGRVIDVDGNIIPGLYAAGEVTGGIHGTNRLGGNALTDITVFGRIAGESAARGR